MPNGVSPAILVVDDERAIADTVVYALRTEGFSPHWCATAGAAREALAAALPALVVLDVGLPDANGFDFCRELRARHPDLPVIFLTARSEVIDRVVGLEIGGDDYLAKPFSPRELTARVKAVLRRRGPAAQVSPPRRGRMPALRRGSAPRMRSGSSTRRAAASSIAARRSTSPPPSSASCARSWRIRGVFTPATSS